VCTTEFYAFQKRYPEFRKLNTELLRMIQGFQLSDSRPVAIPANWPENELVKDRVIIPPAQDVEAAAKRLSEYECYDSSFYYRNGRSSNVYRRGTSNGISIINVRPMILSR
jgi:hypothetical protein